MNQKKMNEWIRWCVQKHTPSWRYKKKKKKEMLLAILLQLRRYVGVDSVIMQIITRIIDVIKCNILLIKYDFLVKKMMKQKNLFSNYIQQKRLTQFLKEL